MYGVFTFDEARRNGVVHLPWVDFLPTKWLNVPVTITLSDSRLASACGWRSSSRSRWAR